MYTGKCTIDLPKLNAKNIDQGNQGKQHTNTTLKHLSTQTTSCGLKALGYELIFPSPQSPSIPLPP